MENNEIRKPKKVEDRLKDARLVSHGNQYLRVTDGGYLELRIFVGMNHKEWCEKIAGPLLKTPGKLQRGPCALLTGGTCGVFIHPSDEDEAQRITDYYERINYWNWNPGKRKM